MLSIQLVDSGLHIFLLRKTPHTWSSANAESNLGFIEQQETNMDASMAPIIGEVWRALEGRTSSGLAYCYNDI
ncbi:MAG: hypothetical protein IPI00_00720 [Flavobacteriales bacterium]|nr:hypothetical protein [Flavobacteriales bacterium]